SSPVCVQNGARDCSCCTVKATTGPPRIVCRGENHRAEHLYLPKTPWREAMGTSAHAPRRDDHRGLGTEMQQVRTRSDEITWLIKGNFMPLRPSKGTDLPGLRDRAVRQVHLEYGGKTCMDWRAPPHSAARCSNIWNRPGIDVRLLGCDHCGHLEWFDCGGAKDPDWWER